MKLNFKKIVSVLATTVMLGSTVAFAAAAYPEPFVKSGAADAALVVGANAVGMDMAVATDLGASLDAKVTATSGISGEGDKYLLEKTSTKFHLGNGMVDVVSATVDDDELPTLLMDGKFVDDDNDEFDYTQKITLSNASVTMFEDNDYKEDEPTVGMRIASGNSVLNYTLEFSDQPEFADLETADLKIMGKEYYILDNGTSTSTPVLTLLDSAEKVTLAEGETKTVSAGSKTYECSIAFIGASEVKLIINGQTTNSLAEQETYKLSDGSYVGVRDISVQDYAGGIKQVEFGIGSGKLKLTSGSDVEINDDSVSRLKATIANSSSKLSTITLEWKADGDLFVAPGSEALMPGFKNVKLTWAGFETPATEKIVVNYGGDKYAVLDDFPLKDSTEDIYLVYSTDNINYTGVGKDSTNILRTSASNTLTYDADTDEYFIVSWKDSGNKDVESYIMRATSFKREDGINKTTFEYRKDGAWAAFKSDRKPGDTISLGNVELTLNATSYEGKNATVTYSGSQHSFNTLYSKDGLKLILPWQNNTNPAISTEVNCNATNMAYVLKPGQVGPVNVSNATASTGVVCNTTTWVLNLFEEDKDDTIAAGDNLNVTLGFNSASTPQVSVTAVTGGDGTDTEVGSSDVFRNFIYSALATEYLWNKGGDQDWVTINYHGGESMAKVYLTAPSVSTTGDKISVVKDSEVSSVSSKNLIVVGGACINKAAAMIVAGSEDALCGDAWAAKTGAGAGKYLIQVAASPYNAGKIAMLVAGYDSADTVAAVAKVKEGTINTDTNSATVYPLATA